MWARVCHQSGAPFHTPAHHLALFTLLPSHQDRLLAPNTLSPSFHIRIVYRTLIIHGVGSLNSIVCMPPSCRLQQSLLLLLVFTTSVLLLACTPPAYASTIHKDGYCVMRGNCGSKRTFGKQLPCPDNSPAIQVRSFFSPSFRSFRSFRSLLSPRSTGICLYRPLALCVNPSSATHIPYVQHSLMHSCASCLFQLAVHHTSIPKRAAARTRLRT